MKVPSLIITTAGSILLSSLPSPASSSSSSANPQQHRQQQQQSNNNNNNNNIDHPSSKPYGFQSGHFTKSSSGTNNIESEESINDDTYAGSMYYDPQHNLLYFTGATYATFFDSATNLPSEIKGAMGMSQKVGGRDVDHPHLEGSDCFLGILKLPQPESSTGSSAAATNNNNSDNAPWLNNNNQQSNNHPELIYARRFGTPQNTEVCSSILMLPNVNDSLLQTSSQLKLALLGHVNPRPLGSAELNAMGPPPSEDDEFADFVAAGPPEEDAMGSSSNHPGSSSNPMRGPEYEADGPGDYGSSGGGGGGGGGGKNRKKRWLLRHPLEESISGSTTSGINQGELLSNEAQEEEWKQRQLEYKGNRGGFLHSLSSSPNTPITHPGHSYGFIADFDLSLTLDETFTVAEESSSNAGTTTSFHNAYGALLGGNILESSPLVYPVAMTQNKRDPNQIYVVSMHSDMDDSDIKLNPEYLTKINPPQYDIDGTMHERTDMTVGGAGGSNISTDAVHSGGVPKYGTDFYVKVQQMTVTPYEQLMDVEPTIDERIKRTMTAGWGFGFKLNDAEDVRPSAIVFVKGRTPNDDLLLLGGTTRKTNENGESELDGFITRLIPPVPSPIEDMTTGNSVQVAKMEDERVHPTKRIDSTTGRDETVTAICLPPPNRDGIVTHAYIVGSTTSSDRGMSNNAGGRDPSLAYILKMRLDDLSTVWKEHFPSIHPTGNGGDVLGEGCTVSPDGSRVYLAGTIDGGSALNTGLPNMNISPIGGSSDIFVIAFDVQFGNVQWAKQLGTVYEDTLARGGGVQCDNEGNVIVMGSSRGGVQRYRPDKPQQKASMASDVFIMSLSWNDGGYVNAPYVGKEDVAVSSSGGGGGSGASVAAAASTASSADPTLGPSKGGLSAGAKAGISLIVIGVTLALLSFALRRRRRWDHRKSRKRYNGNTDTGDILRGWNNGGDDFSYDNRPLGGRRSSSSPMTSPSGNGKKGGKHFGFLRRGGSDDSWDDGTESITRNHAAWMTSPSTDGGDDSSIHSTGSNSSKGSYKSKNEENADFLSSLRQEANATMKKMMKASPDVTADPRLDGGASIKSLLTHYREVKKGGLFEGDSEGEGSEGGSVGGGSKEKEGGGNGNNKVSTKRKNKPPPPPPPPRRKNNDQSAAAASVGVSSPDGLSEFTIV